MKYLLFIVFSLILSSCKKNNCTDAIVTLKHASACRDTSLIINGTIYRTDNLPVQNAVEGSHICIQYNLYGDPKMCACCGGTKVSITSVH
jgi:hypothetical protein